MAAAIAGADRQTTADVLDQLLKIINFAFDFRKKASANVELLRAKAARIATYGIEVTEPTIGLTILANIELATQNEYGHEFRTTMQVIRKKYKYNHVHTAESIKNIMTELASADSVQILKEAPAPNEIVPRGAANAVTDSISVLQKLMQGPASIYSDFNEYETAVGQPR